MRFLLGLLLGLLLAPLAATAQTDERLPDLTPRAFEIRGDLQISLPNLERQPLRGFAPPPRTYVVPADRVTFVAPYGQPLNDLPADALAQPEPPQVSALAPLTGRIDAGFGRYVSRLGRVTVSSGGLGVDVGYSGYSGFQPFPNPADPLARFAEEVDAVSDAFDGRLSYTSRGPTRLAAALVGDYQRYSLLGADIPGASEPALRTSRTIGGEASVSSRGAQSTYTFGLTFASTDVASDAEDGTLDIGVEEESFTQTATRIGVDGGLVLDRVRFDAGGTFSGLGDEGLGASLTGYHAGGALRLDVGRGELEVGARALGYSASDLNGGGSSTNVGPVVRFETPLSASTRAFVRADPSMEGGTLDALFRDNPYAIPEPIVAPTLRVIDGTGGVEIQGQSVRFTLYGGGSWSPVYQYFSRTGATPFVGLYEARYGDVTVLRAGATATLYAPGGLRVTVGAEGRNGTLANSDVGTDEVPYLAPLTGSLSVALPFSGARGLFQLTGTAESARPTEDPDADAEAWATVDAEASYLFATNFGALVRAERLAGRAEQWPGYPRPPATVLAGLRIRW